MKKCLSTLLSVLMLLCAVGCTNTDNGTATRSSGGLNESGSAIYSEQEPGESPGSCSSIAQSSTSASSSSQSAVTSISGKTKEFDLTANADSTTVLANPDKGWYMHYYDNNVTKYGAGKSATYILSYMSYLDHVYLRLPWSILEPQEGNFNWEFIDKVIDDFVAKGKGVSFRITCKESGDYCQYATPKWVKNAGANGKVMSDGSWEPDYGDSVFLKKLENFHKAFAERYASKKYVRYIDVGSFGDWGEGHTSNSSNTSQPWSIIKKHLDIYAKYYPSSLIVLSDDFVGSGNVSNIGSNGATLRQYVINHGWTWRDDSICVDWFMKRFSSSYSIRSLYLFNEIWEKQPVVMELEHYSAVINTTYHSDNWNNGETFKTACRLTHATYAGFHGYIDQFMSSNKKYAEEMANLLGYWYFLDKAAVTWNQKTMSCKLNWRNEGFSKAYNKYTLDIILTDSNGKDHVYTQSGFDNTKIKPKDTQGNNAAAPTYTSTHQLDVSELAKGEYTISVRLHKGETPVLLALNSSLKGDDGRYTIGKFTL